MNFKMLLKVKVAIPTLLGNDYFIKLSPQFHNDINESLDYYTIDNKPSLYLSLKCEVNIKPGETLFTFNDDDNKKLCNSNNEN